MAARPGRTKEQGASRFNHWREAGIIPADEQEWGPGGHAYVFPQSAGAIAAVLFDLFDAGIVTDKQKLATLWRYFSDPHHDGGEPLITHVLGEVAVGRSAWLVMTLWRSPSGDQVVPTCSVRFEEDAERPIEPPAKDFDVVADYVINLHLLLGRFVFEKPPVSEVN